MAVLDACVLYPVYVRDLLLTTSHAGRLYDPRWSERILDEVTRNLVENDEMTAQQAQRFAATLAQAFPFSTVPSDGRLIPCLTNDEKDRHVVETALVARAEVIVTRNLADFREADLSPLGLVSEHPDAFLSDLYAENRSTLVNVLETISKRYSKPPLAFDDLIDLLSDELPRTMGLLTAELP